MSSVIVSLEPSSPLMLLVAIRDEAPGRAWLPPAWHWPELPLIGGRDERAGGTWLAVHPAIPRVACVLNGRDPFHLIVADIAAAQMLSWDGVRTTRTSLGPGTHLITSAGLDPQNPHAIDLAEQFAAARPAASPFAQPGDAWGGWLKLAEGTELPQTGSDQRPTPSGPIRVTSSVSYVAFGPGGMRYDFRPVPGQISAVSTAR